MATEADVRLALEPFAERLAEGAAAHLAQIWKGEMATADVSLLPDLIGARLGNPLYQGFVKPVAAPAPPATTTQDPSPPAETRDDRFTDQHRAKMARSGANWLSGISASPDEIARAKAEDQQAIAQAQSTSSPWLKPGMTPNEAVVASHDHHRKNNGAMWLRGK